MGKNRKKRDSEPPLYGSAKGPRCEWNGEEEEEVTVPGPPARRRRVKPIIKSLLEVQTRNVSNKFGQKKGGERGVEAERENLNRGRSREEQHICGSFPPIPFPFFGKQRYGTKFLSSYFRKNTPEGGKVMTIHHPLPPSPKIFFPFPPKEIK